jgi:hypothetical protein
LSAAEASATLVTGSPGMRVFAVAIAVFFAAPGVALASPSLVARDLPIRSGVVAKAPQRFDLVGLHWRGTGAVRFRTQNVDGRWNRWRAALPESEDRPDRGTSESRRSRGWRLGNPYWVGPAERIQYRLSGDVKRLRAFFVRSPLRGGTPRNVQPFAAGAPAIITRTQWGANERIRRKDPRIADGVHLAIVHHTAGSNSYSRSQSAAIVRAIEVYHVLGNGWDDIGYNFLVDKYGQVFEGRWGGMEKAVVGAHAMGFNLGSVGVSLLGNYNGASLTPAARAALVKLIAWRLDVAHVDPLSRLARVSTGNPEYPRGASVQVRAIAGHRDVYPTSCPGSRVYALLPAIARQVSATGVPKIYSPVVFGAVGGNVRFTARLSSVVPWTVTVTDALGHVAGTGIGTGRTLDWTWDASLAPRGRYTYTIAAGGFGRAAARPATGALGQAVPQLSISRVRVEPGVVSPNGDGVGDTARIDYTLGAPAWLTVALTDPSGAPVASLFSGPMSGGAHSFAWNQIDIPDGRYTVTLSAQSASGKAVSSKTTFYVDRTLASLRLDPQAISPNGDGLFESTVLSFRLTAAAAAKVELWRTGKLLALLFDRALGADAVQVPWNGRIGTSLVPDGSYELVVKVTDALTTVSQKLPLVVDTAGPRLRLVSRAKLRFRSSEPATVTARFDGRRVVKRIRRGAFAFPLFRGARHFVITATDSVGNKSVPLRG